MPNIRVTNAFMAMRALGITEDVVKPVLRKLLRVFEKNWEPIEDDNYRVLADAVFEYQETNVALHKRKLGSSNEEEEEAQLNDETERMLKRASKPQVGNGTSSVSKDDTAANGIALLTTILEPRGSSENSHSQHTPMVERERIIASHPVIENGAQMYANAIKTIQANPNYSPYFKDKGKKISSQVPDKEKMPIHDRPSRDICLKEPKVAPGIAPSTGTAKPVALALIQPREEPVFGCPTVVPSPVVHANTHPNSLRLIDASNDDCSYRYGGALRTPPSPCQDEGDKEPGHPVNRDKGTFLGSTDPSTPNVSSVDLEFASSLLGEVRISLSCTHPFQTDFRMPNVDAILKLAAEKFVQPENTSSNISVKKVIRHVCLSYLELGSKPKESVETADLKVVPAVKKKATAPLA